MVKKRDYFHGREKQGREKQGQTRFPNCRKSSQSLFFAQRLTLWEVVWSNGRRFMEVGVNETVTTRDPWRAAAFGLWELFFLVGLLPEPTFRLLRDAGGVLPQRAVINSPYAITIALAGFVAVFAYNQCRQHGLSHGESGDKSLQYLVVALVAFLPVDFIGVLNVVGNELIRNRSTIYLSTAAKSVAWLYLMVLICKYYLGYDSAFVSMPSFFPSTRRDSKGSGGGGGSVEGP